MNTSEEFEYQNNLIERIATMRRTIDILKRQIKTERYLLNAEKMVINNNSNQDKELTSSRLVNYSIHPSSAFLNRTNPNFGALAEHPDDRLPISSLSKQRLRDIEEKCDTELEKLHKYIHSIKELKTFWRNIGYTEISEEQTKWMQSRSCYDVEKSGDDFEGVPSMDYARTESCRQF